jgi:choline transport protein
MRPDPDAIRSYQAPINAIILSWFIDSALSIIPLGSAIAFGNIQMIGNSGLLVSYIVCIACRLHHRNTAGVYGHLDKAPPLCLDLMGGNIKASAICFLICFLVAGMFPSAPNPTTETMNWASLALGGTIIVARSSHTPAKQPLVALMTYINAA